MIGMLGNLSVDPEHEAAPRPEASMHAALEALPVAIYMTDPDGVVTFYNRSAADLVGRVPRIGKDRWCVSWRIRHADGSPLAHEDCPMALALRHGSSIGPREIVVERPDGTLVPIIAHPTPIFSPAGEMTGAINMLVDISRQKRTEAAFREAEQTARQLAPIVQSSDDAIISKDLDGRIVTWNEGAKRLFGYAADEVVGKPMTILFPADLYDQELGILERIRRGERVDHFETKRQRSDGSLLDVSVTVSPVHDGEGRVVGASNISRDIGARKRAEEALAKRLNEQAALFRLTERLYRSRSLDEIYDAALDAILGAMGCDRASILLMEEGSMRFVAWRNLSEGYRLAVDGHSPWQCEPGDPDPIFLEDIEATDGLTPALKETIATEGVSSLGFIPLFAGGELIGTFMAYYDRPHSFDVPAKNLALIIARQLGFGIQRMRAEEARRCAEGRLRESERRLQLALEAGRMGAWEWNIRTGKVIWSPGLEALHCLSPGAFGGTIDEFRKEIHPDDLALVESRLAEAVAGRSDYHVVYRMRRPDAAERWLEAFGRLFSDKSEPVLLAGVCMDITERKEAEAQRNLLVAELSHRVKNTLATVISIARQSFAGKADATEVQKAFTARIRALGQTHGRLAETNWSGVSIETLLNDELAPYQNAEGTNLRLQGPAATLGPRQSLALGMAVHELATNAAKYGALSTKTGCVEVGWELWRDVEELRIRWAERGGPLVQAPSRRGFGRLLVEQVLASDLGAAVCMDFVPTGLVCTINAPLRISGGTK